MFELYKQIWFWLMLIFFALIIISIVLACAFSSGMCCAILFSQGLWAAIGAVSTAVGVVVALVTYRSKVRIEAKQKTYEAIYRLKDDVYDIEREIGRLTPEDVDKIVENQKRSEEKTRGKEESVHSESVAYMARIRLCKKVNSSKTVCNQIVEQSQANEMSDQPDRWERITKYLTKLEHFSTCVNQGIFDIDTVKKMSGDYLIRQKKILDPIIEYKARANDGRDTYTQFKKMIETIEQE